MINISFINLILIIANNASNFKIPCNPYLFAYSALSSPRPSAPVVSGTSRSSASVKSSDLRNSIADFFVDILANLFGNYGVHVFSDLAVDLVLFPSLFFLSDLSIFDWFLQDDFFTLAADAFFSLDCDIFPDHPSIASYPLSIFLSPCHFTTFEHLPRIDCLFPSLLPPFDHSTTYFALSQEELDRDIPLNYPPSPGLFLFLLSFGNFTNNK